VLSNGHAGFGRRFGETGWPQGQYRAPGRPHLDLSARIIDLMRAGAVAAEDPLLMAAVAYVRTETFFATGDLTSASRLLIAAADALPADLADSAPVAAAYGALHMRAAVVAGRAGKADTAWDHPGCAGGTGPGRCRCRRGWRTPRSPAVAPRRGLRRP
jgi:hypothetical protein